MHLKNSQKWRNICVLPFKTMAIMATCSILIYMNVKEFKPKIHLIKLSLSFNLGPLKVNTYCF
jgi:hypothetical protein